MCYHIAKVRVAGHLKLMRTTGLQIVWFFVISRSLHTTLMTFAGSQEGAAWRAG